jgi:hypothetical protein
MIRSIAIAAAAAAALAIPASALAADAAMDAFHSICWDTANDYVGIVKAATDAGWTSADVQAQDEEGVSVTDKDAREKPVEGGGRLTLLVSRGIRHISSGDLKVTTCKISFNKPDPALISDAQSWIGGAADGGDATLAIYYVALAPGKPNHVGKAGMGAALTNGGISILKFQQDSSATIMVDQSYSK